MIKQLLIIGLAAIMFVGVWVIVLIQFTHDPNPASLNYTANTEVSNERAFDFPDSIKNGAKKEEDVVSSNVLSSVEIRGISNQLIDLRDYDFSDVSTADGVPIGAILDKLDLD
ncbi:hypothetical protein [Halalkalibacter alkalisediminis]|uniref:Uncharacterized protein n=1 Tax=Halalkalibacter alkalisediminis TaxID=935616 RepID=A0ABV6NGV4_9BACI|nr:hypothetical protein [Halalkalibacter alkalisediminis]